MNTPKVVVTPVERMISHDMLIALLTLHDSVTSLANSDDEKAKGFYLAVQSGVREFNVKNSSSVGQAQQTLLAYLVSKNAVTQNFADAALGYANSTKTTIELEAEYPQGNNLFCSIAQGADVFIETDKDMKFDVYLATCPDTMNPDVDDNYSKFPVSAVSGESVNGKLVLRLGSRKLNSFNKIYVTYADESAKVSVTCQTNRG